MWAKQKQLGFTIVELLIVIVVIGVLAAITIVAYNGIQKRAQDTVIQSDINNLVKKVREYEADNGVVPTAGSKTASPDSTKFPGITFLPTKSAYSTSVNNLYYCSGFKSGVFTFAISAQSKAGTVIVYRPNEGFTFPGP
jgi:prepilin-type N-terminal cleavage/methylation domain-containing protein